MFGFFINYSISKTYDGTDMQWMFPTLIQLVPAAIWGLGMLICEESPRWLLYVGRRTQAVSVLARLRHLPCTHPTVVTEIAVMEHQILQEREAVTDASQWRLLQETFGPVENRRRFFLVFMAHLFSQWSGGNAITQYLPTILGYLGTSGDAASLTTGIYAAVKFGCVLVFSLVLVDFVGRRRSLMAGITLQITTLAYLACYLGITRGMTTTALLHAPSASRASTGAIAAIFLHGVGWVIGWFSMPFLIGAEIFPIRIRSLAVSLGMACHWLFAFGCSRATPDLLEVTHEWGAFAFFACICLVSLVYVFFAMPVSDPGRDGGMAWADRHRTRRDGRWRHWTDYSSGPGTRCIEWRMRRGRTRSWKCRRSTSEESRTWSGRRNSRGDTCRAYLPSKHKSRIHPRPYPLGFHCRVFSQRPAKGRMQLQPWRRLAEGAIGGGMEHRPRRAMVRPFIGLATIRVGWQEGPMWGERRGQPDCRVQFITIRADRPVAEGGLRCIDSWGWGEPFLLVQCREKLDLHGPS